jgi:hypothetical protein
MSARQTKAERSSDAVCGTDDVGVDSDDRRSVDFVHGHPWFERSQLRRLPWFERSRLRPLPLVGPKPWVPACFSMRNG